MTGPWAFRVTAVIGLLGGVFPLAAAAGQPCSDGVDCYCDRVRDQSSPAYDPLLLACEDFEAFDMKEALGALRG